MSEPLALAHVVPAVRVAEVTAELDIDAEPELPWHLLPDAGKVALQLRTTLPRVTVGSAIARKPGLADAARGLPQRPVVVASPVAGTFVLGGPHWLGLCAMGRLHADQPMPLDWMLRGVHAWLNAALRPFGVETVTGRVEGAWCPGFSDISVQDRKLAGLGFRVTRDWVVMRAVLAVQPMSDDEFTLLRDCHRLIDVEIRREAAIALQEASQVPVESVEAVIAAVRDVATEEIAP